MPNDELTFTAEELDALFADEEQDSSPVDNGTASNTTTTTETTEPAKSLEDKVAETKAFSKRLKESTEKAVKKEREAIAKQLGYDSYDAMIKAQEESLYDKHGIDKDSVSPLVEELVKKRLDEDPRMLELQSYREQQVKEFGQRELAELTKLTDGAITKFEEIPKDVVELWKQTGSLKGAYLQLHGEELVTKARSGATKGTTSHLANPTGGSGSTDTNRRLLTDQEKRVWKMMVPNITDEELNKKTVEIK